jgi:hypothetical protein
MTSVVSLGADAGPLASHSQASVHGFGFRWNDPDFESALASIAEPDRAQQQQADAKPGKKADARLASDDARDRAGQDRAGEQRAAGAREMISAVVVHGTAMAGAANPCHPFPGLRGVEHPRPRFGKRSAAKARIQRAVSGKALQTYVHLPDRSAAAEAAELIARFGMHAASEAAARAERSADLGNVIHFCRWRQIERMILFLASDRSAHTIH